MTVEVAVAEAIKEIRPRQNVWAVQRTVAVFLKDGNELPTRVISQPVNSSFKRDATFLGFLDSQDRFPNWSIKDDQLSGALRFGGFIWKVAIKISGSTCTATASYESRDPGGEFKLTHAATGEPFVAASMTAKSVSCTLSQGDQVTQR